MKFKHLKSDYSPPVWHRHTSRYTNDVLNVYIRPGYVVYHNKWFNVYGKAGLLCSILIKSAYYEFRRGMGWDFEEYEYERKGSTYEEFSNIYLGGSLSVGIKTKLYKKLYIKAEGDYIYGFSNLINLSYEPTRNNNSDRKIKKASHSSLAVNQSLYHTPAKKVNYSMYGGTIGLEYEF